MIDKLARVNDRMITLLGRVLLSTTLHVILASGAFGVLIYYVLWYITTKYGIDISQRNLGFLAVSVFTVLYGSNTKHFWIYTPENYGRILISRIPSLFGVEDITNSEKIERPKKQRAVFEGLAGKWPWETSAQENNPISLTKTTPLNVSVDAQSSEGLTIKVKLVGAMSAIPDSNLVWHNRASESAAIDLYTARINAEAQTLIRGGSSDSILANPTEFFEELKKLFGGDRITEEEQRTGRFVSNITVESAVRDTSTQKLDEARANAVKVKEILDTVIPSCGGNQILEQAVAISVLGIEKAEVPTNINIAANPGKGKKGKP